LPWNYKDTVARFADRRQALILPGENNALTTAARLPKGQSNSMTDTPYSETNRAFFVY
jgi:hypothetical protein